MAIKNLEEEIEDLKKELWILNKNIIPNLQNQINTLQTKEEEPSTSQNQWIKIYDKDDSDSAINLGITSGLTGGYGTVTALPDLNQYNKIKLLFVADSICHNFEYDISDKTSYDTRMLINSPTNSFLIGGQIKFSYINSKYSLILSTLYKITFSSSRGASFVNLKASTSYLITKIFAQ